MTNSIIVEWWIFNQNPTYWIEIAKEYKLNLIVSDKNLTIIPEKE